MKEIYFKKGNKNMELILESESGRRACTIYVKSDNHSYISIHNSRYSHYDYEGSDVIKVWENNEEIILVFDMESNTIVWLSDYYHLKCEI